MLKGHVLKLMIMKDSFWTSKNIYRYGLGAGCHVHFIRGWSLLTIKNEDFKDASLWIALLDFNVHQSFTFPSVMHPKCIQYYEGCYSKSYIINIKYQRSAELVQTWLMISAKILLYSVWVLIIFWTPTSC